MFALPPILHRN